MHQFWSRHHSHWTRTAGFSHRHVCCTLSQVHARKEQCTLGTSENKVLHICVIILSEIEQRRTADQQLGAKQMEKTLQNAYLIDKYHVLYEGKVFSIHAQSCTENSPFGLCPNMATYRERKGGCAWETMTTNRNTSIAATLQWQLKRSW